MIRRTVSRRATRRRASAAAAALLGTLVLFSLPPSPRPAVRVGVAADQIETFDSFATATRTAPGLYLWYQSWAYQPDFDTKLARAAAKRGALPVITWEPWNPDGGVEQPRYSLASIASGRHDEYIARFAEQIRDSGLHVGLRFLHELNAPYYPWGAGVNGNSPEDAIAAWHHARQIFDAVGARDITWIWSVNIHDNGTVPYGPLYPGDDVVDWVGVDGYNGGDALPWGGWRTPAELFGSSVADLRRLSVRPVSIMETGSTELGGDKARWITQLFDFAARQRLLAVIWFEYDKEADWRVQSSAAAAQAFGDQAALDGSRRTNESDQHSP